MDQIATLRAAWNKMSSIPGGARLFGKMVGRAAPYTGTIDPEVLELRPGYAKVQMRDRSRVRNHLRCIHAVALINLAEVSSGLAFLFGLPPKTRGILKGLSIDYIKKGRGTLTAECYSVIPQTNERAEHLVEVVTRDASGDIVTRAQAKWLVGPMR